jgi:hypothetical protein
LLSDGRWHSAVELHAICWRYGARLWDLRQEGYTLDKRATAEPQIEEWRLLSAPPGAERAIAAPASAPRPSRSRTIASGSARPAPQEPQPQLSLIGAP